MPLPAVGGHDLEAGNLHELTLERRGDIVRHRVGRGARVVHADLDHRIVDGRQVVHGKREVRERAEQDDGGGEDYRHYGPADKRF